MAVRFDASTDRLYRTDPPSGDFTICAWIYITTDRNAYSCFFSIGASDNDSFRYLGTNDDGTTVLLYCGLGAEDTGTNLSTGTWYHLAFTGSDTNDRQRGYLNGVLDVSTAQSTNRSTARIEVGNDATYDEWLNGRVAYIKAWNAELTADEIKQEMYAIRPVRTADLWGWWPTFPGATERDNDYGGDGRDWTQGGTLADEDPPPVSWGAGPLVLMVVAAGDVTVTPAAVSAVASSVNPTVVLGSVTVSPTAVSAVASSVNPTVVLGSITITPAARTAVASSIDPTVIEGGVTITPSAVSAVAGVVAPTVVQSSMTVTPSASSGIISTVNPTVVLGSITITPSALTAVASSVNPTVVLGSITITPSALTAVVSSVAPVVVVPVYKNDSNLQGLWLLEEASGTRYDYTGNDNDLTDNNTVGQSADSQEGSYSADFEATNSEYLSIADGSQTGLDITGDWSVCFWFKIESIDQRVALSKYDLTGDERAYMVWLYDVSASKYLTANISSDGAAFVRCIGGTALGTATWYHGAAVYDGTDIRVYLDGTLDSNGSDNPKTYAAGIYNSSAAFMLGYRSGGTYWDGLLDEVAIFDRALLAEEVLSIYNDGIQDVGVGVTVPVMMHHYRMMRTT